jgi:hypothetical protein
MQDSLGYETDMKRKMVKQAFAARWHHARERINAKEEKGKEKPCEDAGQS